MAFPEKSWATPGDRGVQTYDTEYGRVGLAICFDIHTILEKYQPKRTWALLYPIAWVDEEHPAEWFFHGLPARVSHFQHYVIGANWSVDRRQAWRGYRDWPDATSICSGGPLMSERRKPVCRIFVPFRRP